MQTALIITLADLVESRDKNTGQHIKKTAVYVNSAPLHDIGKIVVPDSILNKPGKLTKEEFDLMKTHTTEGEKIINSFVVLVEK